MRKNYSFLILIVCLIIIYTPLRAQNCWSSLGTGVPPNVNSYIPVMINYNGNLIAAGSFDSIGGVAANNIASWNGTSWSALGPGIGGTDNEYLDPVMVEALAVYNGELYAAGQFDSAGGIPVHNIAKWNGYSWSDVGGGMIGTNFSSVNALAVYNGALYGGGWFDTAGNEPALNIARWDGINWSAVDSGVSRMQTTLNQATVYCLTPDNGLLYVGGSFNRAGNINPTGIAVWNDTAWSALGSSLSGDVTSIAFNKGLLYAAMTSGSPGTYTDSLFTWDGTIWSAQASITTNYNIGIDALLSFNGNLIVSGGFDSIGGIAANNIAQWDGTSWSEFGSGLSGGPDPQGNALYNFNGNLYVSGVFSMAGTDSVNSIAEYTCATDGVKNLSTATQVQLYPNPADNSITIANVDLASHYTIEIISTIGQTVYLSALTKNSLDISSFAAGIYTVVIRNDSGTLTKKLIITR